MLPHLQIKTTNLCKFSILSNEALESLEEQPTRQVLFCAISRGVFNILNWPKCYKSLKVMTTPSYIEDNSLLIKHEKSDSFSVLCAPRKLSFNSIKNNS